MCSNKSNKHVLHRIESNQFLKLIQIPKNTRPQNAILIFSTTMPYELFF